MEYFFELILDCFLELVTEGGMDVMADSESTRKLPKWLKAVLVAFTLLFFIAFIGIILFLGVTFLINGNLLAGILLSVVGVVFLISMIIKFKGLYRRRLNNGDIR